MDRKLINPQIVTDIANAIRAKKGTTDSIVVSDLATEIASIQSMPQSTKDLATLVGGATATDEITTNNDLAKGLTDTPSEYKFKEQVTANGGSIKDTIAFVDKVKGNCIKWNQLLNLVNGSSTDRGVTLTKNNGKMTLSGTCTGSFNFSLMDAMPIVVGHKYLIWDKGQTYPISTSNEASLQLYGSGVIQTQIYEKGSVNYAIGTATTSGNAQLRHRVQNGNTYNLASEPMIVDLTEIGMESATPTDIVSYLGYQSESDVPVMAYQPTTIVLNSNNKSICSKDSNNVVLDNLLISGQNAVYNNLWDETWESGLMNVTGIEVARDSAIRMKGFVKVSVGKTYYLKNGNLAYGDVHFYDTNKVHLSGIWSQGNKSFVVPSGAEYIRVAFPNYGTTYRNDIAIIEGTYGEYTPYGTPKAIFPNGLCSAGEVRDILDLANGIATKKIGVVDLGTLSWSGPLSNNRGFYSSSISSLVIGKHNAICAKYPVYSGFIYDAILSNSTTSILGINSSGAIYIKDIDKLTYTASEFKTAMSGVLLYYELATPSETTIAKAKAYYKVSANGKEIAVSESLSAPLVADIAYRGMSAEDLINELNG